MDREQYMTSHCGFGQGDMHGNLDRETNDHELPEYEQQDMQQDIRAPGFPQSTGAGDVSSYPPFGQTLASLNTAAGCSKVDHNSFAETGASAPQDVNSALPLTPHSLSSTAGVLAEYATSQPHAYSSLQFSTAAARNEAPTVSHNAEDMGNAHEDSDRQSLNQVVRFAPVDTPVKGTGPTKSFFIATMPQIQNSTQARTPSPAPLSDSTSSSSTSSSEALYCICNDVESGQMIKCDNNCKREWFHFECVGLYEKDVPSEDEEWYCPDCREELGVNMYGRPARETRSAAGKKTGV